MAHIKHLKHLILPRDQGMFTLITSYYRASTVARQAEIDEALKRNLQCPCIQRVYLFNDAVYDVPTTFRHAEKIRQVVVGNGALAYDIALSWINAHLQGQRCILSNSDIVFDMTLFHLYAPSFDRTVYALTRWDEGTIQQDFDSQDCWIFEAPLTIPLEECAFRMGIRGCDNRFAHVLSQHGYTLLNPCQTVRSHHLHSSQERSHQQQHAPIPPPYAFIAKHRLGEVPKPIPPRLE